VRLKDPDKNRRGKASFVLGLGLDGDDGHLRLTRGENLLLLGGSENTHEQMQEKCLKLGEELERQGKTIRNASARELRDILHHLSNK
jgi:hypothetical protein